MCRLFLFALALSIAMRRDPYVLQPRPEVRNVVTGKTGQGKSKFIEQYGRIIRRQAWFDPKGEHNWLGLKLNVYEFEERKREFADGGVVSVQVMPYSYGQIRGWRTVKGKRIPNEHERFCRTCLDIGRLHVGHEEVLFFASASPSETYEYFGEMIAIGRAPASISMTVSGQRLSMFPTLYRDNASRVVAFRLGSKSIPALYECFDGAPNAELAFEAPFIPDHHFLDWTPTTGARLMAPLRLG